MSAVVRLCVGPCLWRSMPADAALSEKSPHLGSAQARLSLSKNPKVQPEDLRGRDRSPSGPARLAEEPCKNVHIAIMFFKKVDESKLKYRVPKNYGQV